MIDQGKHTGRVRFLEHARSLAGVQRHRLFAEHSLAMIECCERDFHVSGRRRDDADKIDIVVRYDFLPVISNVFDAKLFCNCFRAFAMTACDRDDPCTHAIAKPWDLSGAGKPCPDNSNTERRLFHGPVI